MFLVQYKIRLSSNKQSSLFVRSVSDVEKICDVDAWSHQSDCVCWMIFFSKLLFNFLERHFQNSVTSTVGLVFSKIYYKFLTNSLWISYTRTYELLVNFLQTSFGLLTNFFWTSCELLLNFLQVSNDLLLNLLWTSYKLLTNYLQTSYELLTNSNKLLMSW